MNNTKLHIEKKFYIINKRKKIQMCLINDHLFVLSNYKTDIFCLVFIAQRKPVCILIFRLIVMSYVITTLFYYLDIFKFYFYQVLYLQIFKHSYVAANCNPHNIENILSSIQNLGGQDIKVVLKNNPKILLIHFKSILKISQHLQVC